MNLTTAWLLLPDGAGISEIKQDLKFTQNSEKKKKNIMWVKTLF